MGLNRDKDAENGVRRYRTSVIDFSREPISNISYLVGYAVLQVAARVKW